ncbi:hypothetical protein RAC90_13915 [Pantoea sp. CS_6]|uniref:DUF6862 domain-containing protein n=1 Tax=Pantoea sp. CS_6 TaxID=3055795 RepID=UPI0035C0EA2A
MEQGKPVKADGLVLIVLGGDRPASEKPNSPYATTGTQSNFETYPINSKGESLKIGNGNALENNALSGKDAQEKNSIELALSETGLALHPRTAEDVAALENRHDQLTKLDAEVDKYLQDACSQGRVSPACQDANALAQGLQDSYSGYLGGLT